MISPNYFNALQYLDIVEEDFLNYKKPAMFIGTCFCDFKCARDGNFPISLCQNSNRALTQKKEINISTLVHKYLENNITEAIVFGGMEPFFQLSEIISFLEILRIECQCDDDVVIYTGYYPHELDLSLDLLKKYNNIIVKFGRYIPNTPKIFDEVLGVELISNNQFAEKLTKI